MQGCFPEVGLSLGGGGSAGSVLRSQGSSGGSNLARRAGFFGVRFQSSLRTDPAAARVGWTFCAKAEGNPALKPKGSPISVLRETEGVAH